MNILDILKQRKDEFLLKKTENEYINRQIKTNRLEMAQNIKNLGIGQKALQLLTDIANSRRNTMKGKIEGIISEALKSIYGANYCVELSYTTKNNRSSMEIELVKKTQNGEVRRTMEGFGGGVSDCISVPLRLLILLGSRQTDRVCVLDESYKHVDLERIENVAKFIKDIAEKLNMQIILFSHHEAVQSTADTIYQISDNDGTSVVEKIL